MINGWPVLISVFIVCNSFAQNVSLKNDTVFDGKTKFALFAKKPRGILQYTISALAGYELVEIHNGRIEMNGKPTFVVTFLNDNKQAMITMEKGFPLSMLREFVKYKIIKNGEVISVKSEMAFIAAHPLPEGYTDIEQLIEY